MRHVAHWQWHESRADGKAHPIKGARRVPRAACRAGIELGTQETPDGPRPRSGL